MKKVGLQRADDSITANGMQQIVTALGSTAYGGLGIDTSASTGVPSVSSGTWSISATLAASLGGTGLDTSASTGIPVVNSGTWSVPSNAMITPEGGYAIKLINRTGHASVKGEVVIASTSADGEVNIAPTSTEMPIGCVYNAGVAEGSAIWVVVAGIAEVLYDASATTRGNWVQTSALTAGRADGSSGSSPGVAPFREIGHAIASASGNALGKIVIHFN